MRFWDGGWEDGGSVVMGDYTPGVFESAIDVELEEIDRLCDRTMVTVGLCTYLDDVSLD